MLRIFALLKEKIILFKILKPVWLEYICTKFLDMNSQKNIIILLVIFVIAAATRLIPDSLQNFTAIGAIAFMGGALIKNKWLKYLLPLGLLAITDVVLNMFVYSEFTNGSLFYSGMIWVYIPFVISVFIGEMVMTKRKSGSKVVFSGILSGIVFFLLSNFGVWMSGVMYPKTMGGLLDAYYMGVPFFRNTLLSNVVYGLVIYFAYTLATKESKQKIAA